jgi:hypothetical protein
MSSNNSLMKNACFLNKSQPAFSINTSQQVLPLYTKISFMLTIEVDATSVSLFHHMQEICLRSFTSLFVWN